MYKFLVAFIACCSSLFVFAQTPQGHCAACHTPIPKLSSHTTLANDKDVPTTYTIDVLIAYDPKGLAYAEEYGGVDKHAARILELSNSVMANSHIDARFRIVGTIEISDTIKGITLGLGQGLSNEPINRAREAKKADVVVLCSEPLNDGQSGIAVGEASDGKSALASVRASAAVTSYTVVHEIGHIFGCQHSREALDGGTHEYAVGASRAPYYTVMGFPEADGLIEQAPIFSGPQSVWKGVVLGSATEDCVRKIRERLDVVSRFSEEGGFRTSIDKWDIGHTAQRVTVQLTTDSYYFITSDASWLTTSIDAGFNSTQFELSAEANMTGKTRTATLTIGGHDEYPSVYIKVTQEGRTTAVESVTPATAPYWSAGYLVLNCEERTDVQVHTTDGRLLYRGKLTAGQHRLPLAWRGFVVVRSSTVTRTTTHTVLAQE